MSVCVLLHRFVFFLSFFLSFVLGLKFSFSFFTQKKTHRGFGTPDDGTKDALPSSVVVLLLLLLERVVFVF